MHLKCLIHWVQRRKMELMTDSWYGLALRLTKSYYLLACACEAFYVRKKSGKLKHLTTVGHLVRVQMNASGDPLKNLKIEPKEWNSMGPELPRNLNLLKQQGFLEFRKMRLLQVSKGCATCQRTRVCSSSGPGVWEQSCQCRESLKERPHNRKSINADLNLLGHLAFLVSFTKSGYHAYLLCRVHKTCLEVYSTKKALHIS